MIDFNAKFAVAAVVAALLTRGVTPAHAASAHRVWLAVLASPALWLAGEWLIAPVGIVGLRAGVLPEPVLAPGVSAVRAAVLLYLLVAGALLLRTLVGVASVRALTRRARRLDAGTLAELRALAGHPALAIREADLAVPVTAGFVRPVVILPQGWRSITPDGLAAILRHEAAHVRRKDCLIALGCAVLEALVWFTPVVWLAGSRVRWFAEMACDSEAARGMDPETYASELLALATGWTHVRRPLYAITAGAETAVARRIGLLLDEMEQGWRRRVILPVAAAVLIVVMVLAGTVRFSGAAIAAPAHTQHTGHGSIHRH